MSDEALPPSNAAAERALLSICIQHPPAHKIAIGLVDESDFYVPHHQVLWGLLDEMLALGAGIDFSTVYATARGHKDGAIRRAVIGAHPAFLPDLLSQPVVAASVEFHAEQVAAAAQRRRLVEIGQRIQQRALTPGVDQVELIDWAQGEVKAARDMRRGVEIMTMGVDDFMAQASEFINPVIPELLFQGDRLVLTGSAGIGKSMMLWQLCIAAACGIHPFNERLAMVPQRVTVIDRENTIRQSQQRIRPLLAKARHRGHSLNGNLRVHARGQSMDLLNPTEAMSVLRTIEHDKPDLVYLGPAYKLHNDDPDKESVVKRLLHVFDQIREMGAAVMVEAHANKSENMAPSGSNIWSWWPEFGFGLKLLPDSDRLTRHCALVRWRFERDDVADWPEALRAGGDWPWTMASLPFNPND